PIQCPYHANSTNRYRNSLANSLKKPKQKLSHSSSAIFQPHGGLFGYCGRRKLLPTRTTASSSMRILEGLQSSVNTWSKASCFPPFLKTGKSSKQHVSTPPIF